MIQKFLLCIVALALAGTASFAQNAEPPADMGGTWSVIYSPPAGDVHFTANIAQRGSRLTGTMVTEGGEFPLTGAVEGKNFTLTFTRPSGGDMVKFVFKGTVEGEMATGTATLNDDPESPLEAHRTEK